MKKLLPYLFIIFSLTLLSGCSDEISYTLDNPTDDTINVRIDETTYSIEAYRSEQVKLAPGAHQLVSDKSGTIDFTVYPERNGGIINPTLSTYILLNEVYTIDEQSRSSFRPIQSTIIIGNGIYSGSLNKLNGLFIPEQWSYALHEQLPDEITVYNDQKGNIISKIFNLHQFVLYYLDNYGKPDRAKGKVEPTLTKEEILAINQAPILPDFLSAEFQSATLPLRELYHQYITTTDPEQIKEIQAKYHDTWMQYSQNTMYLNAKQSTAENEKANNFVHIISNTLGTSFLITHYK